MGMGDIAAVHPADDSPATKRNTGVSFGVDNKAAVHADNVLLYDLRLGYRVADRRREKEVKKKIMQMSSSNFRIESTWLSTIKILLAVRVRAVVGVGVQPVQSAVKAPLRGY